MSHVPVRRNAAAALIAIGIAAGCSSSPTTDSTSAAGSANQVQALASLAFSPTSLVVGVGANVTWVFGSVGHTVTFDAVPGAPADIGTVNAPNANVSVSRSFAVGGTYYYHCSVHPGMTGAIVVGSTGVTPPPPPPPPSNPYGLRTP